MQAVRNLKIFIYLVQDLDFFSALRFWDPSPAASPALARAESSQIFKMLQLLNE